jgi:hypothetical protein
MLYLDTRYCGEPFYCRPGVRITQLWQFYRYEIDITTFDSEKSEKFKSIRLGN